MRRLLSIVALVAAALGLASSEPAQAQPPAKKLLLAPGERAQGTVSQLDTAKRAALVQTAKGTVELNGWVIITLNDGRTVPENLGSPRVLRKGIEVIVIRLPDGRIIVTLVRPKKAPKR
jgi:hypothetical protein